MTLSIVATDREAPNVYNSVAQLLLLRTQIVKCLNWVAG